MDKWKPGDLPTSIETDYTSRHVAVLLVILIAVISIGLVI